MKTDTRRQLFKVFTPLAFFLLALVLVLVRIAIAQSDPQPQVQCEGIAVDPADANLLRCPAKGVTAVLCPPQGYLLYLEGDYFRCINEEEHASKTQMGYMQCKKKSQDVLYGTSVERGCNTDDVTTRCWYPYELKEDKCVSKQKCPSPNASIIHFEKGAFQCFSNKDFRSVVQQNALMQCETSGGEAYTASATEGCAPGDIATLCPYQYELKEGKCITGGVQAKCTQRNAPIPYIAEGMIQCLSPKQFGSLLQKGDVMQCETSAGEIYNTSVVSGCSTGDAATNCPFQYELKENRCVAKPQDIQKVHEISYVVIERTPPTFDVAQCATYQMDFKKELNAGDALLTAAESVRRDSEFVNKAFKKSFMEHIGGSASAARKANKAFQRFECSQASYEDIKEAVNTLQSGLENVQRDIQLVAQSTPVQNVVIGIQKDIQLTESAIRACAGRAKTNEAKKICFDFDSELSVLKKNLQEFIAAKGTASESELLLLAEGTADLLTRLKNANSRDTKSLQSSQKKKSGGKSVKRKAKKFKSQ